MIAFLLLSALVHFGWQAFDLAQNVREHHEEFLQSLGAVIYASDEPWDTAWDSGAGLDLLDEEMLAWVLSGQPWEHEGFSLEQVWQDRWLPSSSEYLLDPPFQRWDHRSSRATFGLAPQAVCILMAKDQILSENPLSFAVERLEEKGLTCEHF